MEINKYRKPLKKREILKEQLKIAFELFKSCAPCYECLEEMLGRQGANEWLHKSELILRSVTVDNTCKYCGGPTDAKYYKNSKVCDKCKKKALTRRIGIDPMERIAAILYYRQPGSKLSYKEIGNILNISATRVRELEAKYIWRQNRKREMEAAKNAKKL